MNIIRTELSISARAGALDPNLAFSQVFEAHRTLVSQTASSSLSGMLNVISETGLYANAIRGMQKAAEDLARAQLEAAKNPLKAADPSITPTINLGVNNARFQTADTAAKMLNGMPEAVDSIRNILPADSAERGLANDVSFYTFWTRDDGFRVAHADYSKLATIRNNYTQLIDRRDKIEALLNSIPATQQNATRRANIQTLLNTTNDVIKKATPLRDAVDSNIIKLQGVAPTTTDLNNGYFLSTHGNTGIITLIDPSGHQLSIGADGTVDSLQNGINNRWKFDKTTTFVLPNETKVTINPGNPASVLVSRGIHAMTIDNLGPNRTPQTSDFTSLNGRIMDRDSNDGYLVYRGTGQTWTLDGSTLGTTPTAQNPTVARQNVATNERYTELRLDPTDISLSPEVSELREYLAINHLDYDGDGKYNDEEISQMQVVFSNHVRNLEIAYNEALARISAANAALMELTETLDQMRKQAEKQKDSSVAESAENRALMRSLEQRLTSALALLREEGGESSLTSSGNIETKASQVLNQLNQFSQQSSPQTTASTSIKTSKDSTETLSDTSPTNTSFAPTDTTPTDSLGESLRRASRLLTGLSNSLRVLDLPPSVPINSTPETAAEVEAEASAPVLPPELQETLNQLATVLASLLGQGELAAQTGQTLGTPSSKPDPGDSAPQVELSTESDSTLSPLPQQPPANSTVTQPGIGGENSTLISETAVTEGEQALSVDGQPLSPEEPDAVPEIGIPVIANSGPEEPETSSDASPLEEAQSSVVEQSIQTDTQPSSIEQSIAIETPSSALSPRAQDLAIGLQGLLDALSEAGVIDLTALPPADNPGALVQLLLQLLPPTTDSSQSQVPAPPPTAVISGLPGTPPVQGTPQGTQSSVQPGLILPNVARSGIAFPPSAVPTPSAPALLTFLGILAQFGSASRAVAPQSGKTTPGQPELAGSGSLTPLSRSEENTNARLSPSSGTANQQRTSEQVALLLSGLAALGSAGAAQSSGNQGAAAPTSAELRQGLRSFLTALSAVGIFANNQAQDLSDPNTGSATTTTANLFQPESSESGEGKTTSITSNFYTDPEFLKQLRVNLEKAEQAYQDQLKRATALFSESQQTVQNFVTLIEKEEVVQELIKSDELSNEQQELFEDKMRDMRKDLGIEWGGDDARTPATQSELVSRAVRSGMMV